MPESMMPREPDRRREPTDELGDYTRWELDRTFGSPSAEFRTDNQPQFFQIIEMAREKGSLAVLDAGCGTGRGLFDLKDQVDFRTGVPVRAVGINDVDYSQESEDRFVRQAFRNGDMEYRVEDLRQTRFDKPEFDLVFSYEALIHIDDFDQVALNLAQAVRPGGYMYFDLLKEQIDSEKWQLAKQQLEKLGEVSESGIKKGSEMRFYVELHRPAE